MRILIAEDEAIIAQSLAMMLEEMGYRVAGPVATVAEALRLTAERAMDMALLDYRLRDGTTDAVAAALKQAGIPFLLMSGFDRITLGRLGAPVLQKPFRQEQLATALSALRAQVGGTGPGPD